MLSPPSPPPYAAKHNIITHTSTTNTHTMNRQSPTVDGKPRISPVPVDPRGSRVSTALNITFSPPPVNHLLTGWENFTQDPLMIRRQSTPTSYTSLSSGNSSPSGIEVKLGVCSKCGSRITNVASACQALGCTYHNDCFVCCFCGRSLRDKTFYKDHDKIYCEEDYLYCGFQQSAENCAACGHIIAPTMLQALGKSYHPGCFRCCVCNKCMDEQPFTLDEQGRIYCIEDYYLVSAPTCAACGNGILPAENTDEVIRIVAMNREFHVDCYRCEECKVQLTDESTNRCFPLTETVDGGTERTFLLCLSCHLKKIGATPASGQKSLELRRGSGGSLTADLFLGNHNLYSPTPTSYGIASIGKSPLYGGSDLSSSLQQRKQPYQPRRHTSSSSHFNTDSNLY